MGKRNITAWACAITVAAAAGFFGVTGCSGGGMSGSAPVSSVSSAGTSAPYHSWVDGYSFVPPRGWALHPTDPQSGLSSLFSAPTADSVDGKPFVSNINVVVAIVPHDLEETVAETKQSYPTIFVNYQPLVDEGVTLANGESGHLLGGSYDQPGTGALRNLQLFVVDGGKNYVVSATAPAGNFGSYESVLSSSLLSFTLR